ncbi:MAG: hypothetical protein NZ518_02145 [Dehalococcoidia bacterium]|nr:hypothetical protein [Dehalococcoidia bacterium]
MEETFFRQDELTSDQLALGPELADRVTASERAALIAAAIDRFLAGSREEVWRRRRNTLLSQLRVVERNLDYDLRERVSGR